MSCNNCFNGCVETISDQCVKYTGIDISSLGISNGDSLSRVEYVLTTKLISALDGTGIIPFIDPISLCALVNSFLPTVGPITLNDVIDTFIQCLCSLQTQVTAVTDAIIIMNGDYDIGCLTGVTITSDTHTILQATLTKVCLLNSDLILLAADLSTNYVPISEINAYIAAYIASIGSSTLMSNRLIPYSAVEYYGPLTYFDITGKGTGDWDKVYLCNGLNGTPDKRGRVGVGTTTGMGGGTFSLAVDPAILGNPSYTLGTLYGANNVILTLLQTPSHTHSGVTDSTGAHTHTLTGYIQSGSNDGAGGEVAGYFGSVTTASSGTHSHNLVIDSTGGGQSHPNIQPVLACHYIIYIP